MLVVAIFRLYLYKNKQKNCSNLKAEINNYNHILKLKTLGESEARSVYYYTQNFRS